MEPKIRVVNENGGWSIEQWYGKSNVWISVSPSFESEDEANHIAELIQNAEQCIFCGSKEFAIYAGYKVGSAERNLLYWVKCMTCNSFGPIASSSENAINLWNQTDFKMLKNAVLCPFCESNQLEFSITGNQDDMFAVNCKICGAKGSWSRTKQEAIAKWNQRLRGN